MRDLSLLFVNFIVENKCSHVYVLPNIDISFGFLVKLIKDFFQEGIFCKSQAAICSLNEILLSIRHCIAFQ